MRRVLSRVWASIPTLRIRSANRINLDRDLRAHFARLQPGRVLDVGAKSAPYRDQIPQTAYLTLDVDPSRSPDICSDIHELEPQAEPFDTVLVLEVLEHLVDPQRAIDRIHGVLGPGGVCLLSTRFLYRYHPDPGDYYRFTRDSLQHLFRNFSEVEVCEQGNRIQVIWEMINPGGKARVLMNLLNPVIGRLPSRRTRFPLGFIVRARR